VFLAEPPLSRNLWNRRRISPSPRTKGVLCVTYTVFNFQRAPTPEGAYPALAEPSPIARNRLLQLPVRTTDNLTPRRLPRRRWDPRPQPGESFHLPKAYINTTRAACQPASFGGLSSRATCLRLSAVAKRIFTIARKRPIVKNFLIPHLIHHPSLKGYSLIHKFIGPLIGTEPPAETRRDERRKRPSFLDNATRFGMA